MAAQYKISPRKVVQVLLTLVVATCCLVAIISASKLERKQLLTNIEVHIKSNKMYHFVEEQEILDEAIYKRNVDAMHTPLGQLDLKSMEQVLKNNPWVADAQLYIDNNRVLRILITQRIPVARLFDRAGNSYYMDKTMNTMPLADNFKYYTSVITNVPVLKQDSASLWLKNQMLAMVTKIQSDSFWNAQVAQIVVDSDNTFEMLPVLGDQRIVFGDTSRMKEKFDNIYAFYKNVLNKIGWDKYETIDVRFKGQVVASPTLTYHLPVDKGTMELDLAMMRDKTKSWKDSVDALAAEKKGKKTSDEKNKSDAPKVKDSKAPVAAAHKDGKDKHIEPKTAKPASSGSKDDKSKGHVSQPAAGKKESPKPEVDKKAVASQKKGDVEKKKTQADKKTPTKENKSGKYLYPEHKDNQ